ncbi:MAG: TRAP transporter large permease [Desulfitobacterium hafniense]|nr:TRAP transporter large permease [Desulfitobacterium hafniense]
MEELTVFFMLLLTVFGSVVLFFDSYSLLALPLYIFAGEIMNSSGVTRRLYNFPLSLIGHVKGGLAHVNVITSMIFAGMSGSAVADAAGLGKIQIKSMKDEGYNTKFSAGIVAAGAMIGPIIPPSTTMIVYAVIAQVSIAKLFIGGLLPGIIMGILLMAYTSLVADRKYNFPRRPQSTMTEKLKATKEAFLPLLTPVIILLGITSGIVTATEAGAVAVIYALFLHFLYNGFDFPELLAIFKEGAYTTIKITFIVMGATIFGWVVTFSQIPDMISGFLLGLGVSKWMILLMINIGLLIMGCFLSITSSQLIATPTLLVLANVYGIDLIHLGVIMTLNLTIGLLTPPVGWVLYIIKDLAEISFSDMVKAVLPFLIPLMLALLIITYIPETVLYLPDVLST